MVRRGRTCPVTCVVVAADARETNPSPNLGTQPRPRRLHDNPLRTCAFMHPLLAWPRAGANAEHPPGLGSAPRGLGGGSAKRTFKGTVSTRVCLSAGTADGEGWVAPGVGTQEVEEKQGYVTPPRGAWGQQGCANALRVIIGWLPRRHCGIAPSG